MIGFAFPGREGAAGGRGAKGTLGSVDVRGFRV